MTTTSELRRTVAALMRGTGDTQADLAAAIGLTQGQISRKLAARAAWTLWDCDDIADHYGITVPQLLSGWEVALAAAEPTIRARQADQARQV